MTTEFKIGDVVVRKGAPGVKMTIESFDPGKGPFVEDPIAWCTWFVNGHQRKLRLFQHDLILVPEGY